MNLPKSIQDCMRYPVAVLGWGVSGRAVGQLLHQLGVSIEVFDERGSENARREFTPMDASIHRLVVSSPGFAAGHPWLRTAREGGSMVISELDMAALLWRGLVVAVTGTNGKTTLSEFLAFALRRKSVDAIAVGNNGYAFSQLLRQTEGSAQSVAVCEVSSFQAEQVQHLRPGALIWTNFEEDHLDRYLSPRAYFTAKWRLVERTGGRPIFVGETVAAAAREFGFELPVQTQIVSRSDQPEAIPQASPFITYPQQENYLLARAYWMNEGHADDLLAESAGMFSLPRHRLSRVAELGGVAYWNDSKATNFGSVLAALAAFDQPVIWIGGGRSKGGDFKNFCEKARGRVAHACLVGETAPILAVHFAELGVPTSVHLTLDEAVYAAAPLANPGQSILFSPGFASFDQFRNYSDRGISFEKTVLSLKNQPVEVNQKEKDLL